MFSESTAKLMEQKQSSSSISAREAGPSLITPSVWPLASDL